MSENWGLEVKPGTFRLKNHQRKLRVTKATLGGEGLGLGTQESVIQYSIGDQTSVELCSFLPNENVSCTLGLVIEGDDTVEFRVTGDRVICLHGYMELTQAQGKDVEHFPNSGEKPAKASEKDLKSPNIPNNTMFRSGNITHRLFERRMRNPPPGACVNQRFYENILPSSTFYDVKETPKEEQTFLKFTDDGKYIISFSLEKATVIIYRASLCSYSSGSSHASNFSSYATRLYSTNLSEDESFEYPVHDFFIHVPAHDLGIFASYSHTTDDDPDEWDNFPKNRLRRYSTRREVRQSMTFHLIRLGDGTLINRLVLKNDYIELRDNYGAHIFKNLLVLTSSRKQLIMIYEVGPDGFIHKQNINFMCTAEEHLFATENDGFMIGVRRCLPQARLLDEKHLLIKFGSDMCGVADKLHAIYNTVAIEVVPFCETHGSYEFFPNFGQFFDLSMTTYNGFSASCLVSHTNIVDVAHLLSIRDNRQLFSVAVNQILVDFPFECQLGTPSPYFQPSRFQFDETMPCHYQLNFANRDQLPHAGWKHEYEGEEAAFVSLRHPLEQKFIIKAGPINDQFYHRATARVLVHPFLPLMISFLRGMYNDDCINIHRK